MEPQIAKTTPVTRVVMVLGIASLIGMIGYGGFLLYPVGWSNESFTFVSGPECAVIPDLKLTIFVGDDGPDEVFDRIDGYGYGGPTTIGFGSGGNSSSVNNDGIVIYSHKTENSRITMQFFDGKGSLTVSRRGTKLTLADGREFKLDGKTPLWLRCKTDGTIVQMDELPEGFVEFFESPPTDPGLIRNVKSYPEAFVK